MQSIAFIEYYTRCKSKVCYVQRFPLPSFQKPLFLEGLHEAFRHGLVVFSCISDIGVYLRKCLLVVYPYEFAVLWQCFLGSVVAVNVVGRVGMVVFSVDEGIGGQTVGESGLLVWPSNGQCGYGHDKLWQLQGLDDELRHVDGCSKEADAQSLLFGEIAECLSEQQGIGAGIDERQEVVVPRVCMSLQAPVCGTPEIRAYCYHYGGARYHGLVEVCWCQSFFHLFRAGNYYAV